MWVKTLSQHSNAYGPVYAPDEAGNLVVRAGGDHHSKRLGDTYEHPDPAQLIADRLVVETPIPEQFRRPLDLDGDGEDGGSPAGENASAAIGRRRRQARAA